MNVSNKNQDNSEFREVFQESLKNSAILNSYDSVMLYLALWLTVMESERQRIEINLQAGDILLQKNKFEWAAEIYQKGLAIRSNWEHHQYQLHSHLAFCQVQTGELAKAESHARSAIRINPYQAGGHLVLGLVREVQEKYQKALVCYLAASAYPLYDQTFLDLLGNYYAIRYETQKAILPNQDMAILPAPLKIVGTLLELCGGDRERSIAVTDLKLKLSVRSKARLPLYHPLSVRMFTSSKLEGCFYKHSLGDLLEFQKTHEWKVSSTGRKVQAKFPQHPFQESLPADKTIYITPEGLLIFEDFMACRQRFLELLNRGYGDYLQLGKRHQAETLLELMQKISISPVEKALGWLKKGGMREQFKEYQAAADAYRAGLKFEHDDINVNYYLRNNLGYSLNQIGEHQEAENWCREAIEISPYPPNAYKNLGLALQGQGRLAEAAESFIQSTKAWPADRRSFDHLKEILRIAPNLATSHPDFQEFIEFGEVVIGHTNYISLVSQTKNPDFSPLPKPIQLLVAATQIGGETDQSVFSTEALRLKLGVENEAWEQDYLPTLSELSNGEGESEAEDQEMKDFQGFFDVESLDEIQITKGGKAAVELLKSILREEVKS